MNGYDDMLSALSAVYADAATLADPQTAHLVIDGNAIASLQDIPGVEWRVDDRGERLAAELVIAAGSQIAAPIHTCIGFLTARGTQAIQIRIRIEEHASATIVAHCLFPNAESGSHEMQAGVALGAGAELRYLEGHYHGWAGGMDVRPTIDVQVGSGARYYSDFSLNEGRVGRLHIGQRITVSEDAVAEIVARVAASGTDEVRIRDELTLAGRGSRGLIRTRIALADDAHAEVVGITHGQAEGARGHMDCLELVRDRATARAEPIVDVTHPLAKVTHEAAVGTVDQNQLETLMAHGLTPDEAVELIVTGILR